MYISRQEIEYVDIDISHFVFVFLRLLKEYLLLLQQDTII